MQKNTGVSETLSDEDKTSLKEVAREAIRHGLEHHICQAINSERYASSLQIPGASFVTIKKNGQLRGCIGSLQAHKPLVADVAHNAYAAAFSDHRFAPLAARELADIELEISILSPAQPMDFSDENDLLEQIRPGIDGLILEEGVHRGTFLPTVWESLPDSKSFVQNLKQKAGLSPDYWSPTVKIFRYTSESF